MVTTEVEAVKLDDLLEKFTVEKKDEPVSGQSMQLMES